MFPVRSVLRLLPAGLRRRMRRNGRGAVIVTGVRWDGDGTLVLTGEHPGPRRRVILHHRKTGREHVFALESDAESGRFTARLPVGRIPVFGDELPLTSGDWTLLRCHWAGGRLPGARLDGRHEFRVRRSGADELTLRVRRALAPDEQGASAQARLRDHDYPALRTRPLRDLVLYDSMNGRRYSCNPRALFERLREQDRDLDHVWISADGQFAPPEGARVVLSGTREHYDAVARARYLVVNNRMPPWFRKREGQTYLQTWHGTPLKTLGFDVRTLGEARNGAWERIRGDVPHWDHLISPNPFTTPIMRRAYGYEGPVLETGYPRNDLLNDPMRDVRAARVRAALGLPPGKRVVLYAPTWRDDLIIGRKQRRPYQLALDLGRARAELGHDHVLLLRAHHHMGTGRAWRHADSFVVDASGYPDIADLYLVADVLVTDYSSAMFDFAVTGKPILLFAYDLEHYRDEVRGFYFDLAAEAPGPLVRTSDELIAELRSPDDGAHKQAYADFAARFCPYDDGRAAERVINEVWGN
ncbi:CDP-glycerol glycerophosphotransferase family protein [Actinocorallia longicatena]|uniref:CDP-glycerol glycerophosphotransferase n=1 Tax=Actinocorallia longicatena TaxID=111803 RepID=A0ABP6QJH4_9ACTN